MQLFTTKQIAEQLQVHEYTVLKYIGEGVDCDGSRVFLRASRFGRSYRISAGAVETFLKLTSNFKK